MKCPECGTEFLKKRPWQRYDKPECAQKQRSRRRTKKVRKALRHLDAVVEVSNA